jgi:ribonuclease HII
VNDFESALVTAGFGPVAGVDEAGRGACAGPLVAAAVILETEPCDFSTTNPVDAMTWREQLDDSKALTPRRRESLFERILAEAAAVAWVEVSADECDRWGIQEADIQALRRAVLKLEIAPGFVVSDGFAMPGLAVPSVGMWKADQVVPCVSAASIVAKVVRDTMMNDYDTAYPGYEFARHKGYGTALHQERLMTLGPSPIHRLTYDNVRRAMR